MKNFSISKFPFCDHQVTGIDSVFFFCLDAALFLQRMEQYHRLVPGDKGVDKNGKPKKI